MSIARILLATILATCLSLNASASDEAGYRVFSKKAAFEDIRDNVRDAIVNRGFVVDYVGKLNAMLERTAHATGSITAAGAKSPYRNAEYLQFCPSQLTHDAVSASPLAIANCPIVIFVYELGYETGTAYVGFRLPVTSPSKRVKEVNEKLAVLLADIAKEATK